MVKADSRKSGYFDKLIQLIEEYPKIFVVGVDNVGSKQMQQIRKSLRDKGVLLMGKNTMMRKAIRGHLQKNPKLQALIPHICFNVGFVFTKGDLHEVRSVILANKVAAPAKTGSIAPVPVTVPAGPTTMGPEKTSFFQALQIPTKISRGTIEILSEVSLIKVGDKVGASEASLLNMLGISPFTYGLEIQQVYDDGSTYDPKVLDITDKDLIDHFMEGVKRVAALSLQIGYPTLASAPHSLANGYKRVLAVAVATELSFPLADKVKEMLADPSRFAVAAAPAAPAAAAAAPKAEEKKKKEEPKEEEEEDMGFGLFD